MRALFSRWRADRQDPDKAKRRQARLPVNARASVLIGHASGRPRLIEVGLVDQSDDGVRFWTTEALSAGDAFTIEGESWGRRWAEAVHVTQENDEFIVGARFLADERSRDKPSEGGSRA